MTEVGPTIMLPYTLRQTIIPFVKAVGIRSQMYSIEEGEDDDDDDDDEEEEEEGECG